MRAFTQQCARENNRNLNSGKACVGELFTSVISFCKIKSSNSKRCDKNTAQSRFFLHTRVYLDQSFTQGLTHVTGSDAY